MKHRTVVRLLVSSLILSAPAVWADDRFREVNLVSDLPGHAQRTDSRLVNPWGLVLTPLGTLLVANNVSATSEAFSPAGGSQPPRFGIPTAAGLGPTGVVYNADRRAFVIHRSNRSGGAHFIFCGLDGTLSGWSPDVDPDHAIEASRDEEAVYTGLALAWVGKKPFLYVANFAGGKIEVYDTRFAEVDLDGDFDDPDLPSGYAPFNVQTVGRYLYVAYAKRSGPEEQPGPGLGIVNQFDTQGHLMRRFSSNGPLNAPWAIVRAPRNFGRFSEALLVGNFGDGTINAFNRRGDFLGKLEDQHGDPIVIEGLWGLAFGPEKVSERSRGSDDEGQGLGTEDRDGDRKSRDPSARLYFAAGIEDETHGLFGYLQLTRHQDSDDDEAAPTVIEASPVAVARPLIAPVANPVRLADGSVRFRLGAEPGETVDLRIFDAAGRLVATPARAVRGTVDIEWNGAATDGTRVPAGVYFYRAQSPSRAMGGRFVLLH